MSYATAYWHFLVIGLFVGLAGGSFSVGTPYVARWFPRKRQGFAMGVYGAGNSGAAVNKFVAPALVVAFGWTMVPQVYAAIMLGTLVLFWFFSDSDPAHLVPQPHQVQRPAEGAEGPEGLEVLPVLLHRVRRLRRAEPVDGAVLRRRVRPGHPRRGAAGGLLLAARRRAARGRRLAVRQVRRAQRHLVGDVGELDLPVPAVLPADRHDDHHRRRPEDLPRRPERLRLHRADVHPGHRLGLRQGQRSSSTSATTTRTTSAPSAASSAWPAAWAASCCRSCSAR